MNYKGIGRSDPDSYTYGAASAMAFWISEDTGDELACL